MTDQDVDVLIVGGGVAGLALAGLVRQFIAGRRKTLSIAILEARAPKKLPVDAETDLRVFALAPAARAILEATGAWARLPPDRVSPYERMRVWPTGGTPFGAGSIGFDAAESGVAALGHIVEHDQIRLALWQALADTPGGSVRLITDDAPVELCAEADAMALHLASGAHVRGRLLVGADGANSWVREQLHLLSTGHDYDQLALVTHVSSEQPHQRTAWQCFTPDGPVALLPLADGRSSVVWSCFAEQARKLAALSDDEFGVQLTQATGRVLGNLQVTTRRLAVPLAARHTHRYTGPRFALIGDAAHQIHPLAGQGINLGLQDAAALADTLVAHVLGTRLADPGDALVLRRYERRRKGANLLAMAAMEGLHRLFTTDSRALTRIAAAGLGIVDRLPFIKGLLAAQAAGTHAKREQHERL